MILVFVTHLEELVNTRVYRYHSCHSTSGESCELSLIRASTVVTTLIFNKKMAKMRKEVLNGRLKNQIPWTDTLKNRRK